VACDGNVHAANSIASTHERTPVSVFTEEGVSGGRGAPEHSGSAGDDDGLFADLLAGGGDAFAGLPEMDGGAGFLVDDPNDTTTVKQEHQEHVAKTSPRRESRDDAPPGRDSAGSAAGRKADGESSAGAAGSGSDASHSRYSRGREHEQLEGLSNVSNRHNAVHPPHPQGSLAGGPSGGNGGEGVGEGVGGGGASGASGFGLTMDDYASLERVGAEGMDDFLGPIMDDHAGVGFEDGGNDGVDTPLGSGATWNPGGAMRRGHDSSPQPGMGGVGPGGASDAALAQARAQADARARAMQHARVQGMGAPGGPLGSLGSGAGIGGHAPGMGAHGGMSAMPGGVGAGRGAPPGTHGMPPPSFGGPSMPGAPPGAPPGMRAPGGGVMYFSGPPLPMLHLANGASDAPPSRLERLRRWKEKRKNRNFNKTIRYQSRKVCADNRPRIKGKFVKVGSTPDLGAMDDLGADFEGARAAGGGSERMAGVPENEESAEESAGSDPSGGAIPEGRLARVAGLRRGGGLTNSMSVPAGLAMMGAKQEQSSV